MTRTRVREQLADALDFAFEKSGWGWHEPLLGAVQDLTPAQARFAAEGQHSIWQIVEHVALWTDYMADRLAGLPKRQAGWQKEADWQALTEETDAAWQPAIKRLVEAQRKLRTELMKRSDDELWSPLPGTRVPVFSIVLGLLAHESYHCGQIRYVRALQGIGTARHEG